MFGYFVRRVDKRFQLERSLGLIEEPQADAVARLERLFNTASDPEDLDGPASPSTSTSDASSKPDSSTTDTGANAAPGKKKKDSPLRKYIEKFDQATLTDMTRQVVSLSNWFHQLTMHMLLHKLHVNRRHCYMCTPQLCRGEAPDGRIVV